MSESAALVQARCSMTHWWPRVRTMAVAVPMPRTLLLPVDFTPMFDAPRGSGTSPIATVPPDGRRVPWSPRVMADVIAAAEFTYPVFLRTDHTSGKHAWVDSCFVPSAETLPSHLAEVIESTLMADAIPAALVVREYLPLASRFTAFRGALPIAPERRYFAEAGHVLCHHPYWPAEAIVQGTPPGQLPLDWKNRLAQCNHETPGEITVLSTYAAALSTQLDGAWSLDFAKTAEGWWVFLDAAPAERSWHPAHTAS